MDSGTCRSCKNPIFWIKTKSGKSMPVDTTKLTIVTNTGETHTGYESHFSTCPEAKNWRKDT